MPAESQFSFDGRMDHAVYASVFNDAAQTAIVTSTHTDLTFPDVLHDPYGFWVTGTNTRLTVPAGLGGIYVAYGQVNMDTNATGNREVHLKKNGSAGASSRMGSDFKIATTLNFLHAATPPFNLDAGEYVTFGVFQTSGADRATDPTNFYTRFGLVRLGDAA